MMRAVRSRLWKPTARTPPIHRLNHRVKAATRSPTARLRANPTPTARPRPTSTPRMRPILRACHWAPRASSSPGPATISRATLTTSPRTIPIPAARATRKSTSIPTTAAATRHPTASARVRAARIHRPTRQAAPTTISTAENDGDTDSETDTDSGSSGSQDTIVLGADMDELSADSTATRDR